MSTKEEIRKFIEGEICLKIVQNDTLLGQISGNLGYFYGKLAVLTNKTFPASYFLIDLNRLTMKDDYLVVDLGYNPTNKA